MNSVLKNTVWVVVATGLLAGCKGTESMRAPGISSDDKNMTCEQLQLEMNDVGYIRDAAMRNRSFKARNFFWPFSYPATYSSAQDAVASADARMSYLQRVYGIKKCTRPLS